MKEGSLEAPTGILLIGNLKASTMKKHVLMRWNEFLTYVTVVGDV